MNREPPMHDLLDVAGLMLRVGALRRDLEQLGGIVTQADLARRYRTSPSVVCDWARHPTFPADIGRAGKSRVWIASEAYAWVHVHVGLHPQAPPREGVRRR